MTTLSSIIGLDSIPGKFTTQAVSSNHTLTANECAVLTGNNLQITLPASPTDGQVVRIVQGASGSGSVILRNGKNIMGYSEDMNLDVLNKAVTLAYLATSNSWWIV